jgi:hypothetical protein
LDASCDQNSTFVQHTKSKLSFSSQILVVCVTFMNVIDIIFFSIIAYDKNDKNGAKG